MRQVAFAMLVRGILALAVCSAASGFPQQVVTPSEKDSVLASLRVLYGRSIDGRIPVFAVNGNYLLRPTFSADGLLVKLSIERRDKFRLPPSQLSKSEFEYILSNLDSIKRIGGFEEDIGFSFSSGGNAYTTLRFQNAYIDIAELLPSVEPRPIRSATIYYIYPLTGMTSFPRGSKPEGTNSFALVCVDGFPYRSPSLDAAKVLSSGNKLQTLYVAGPLGAKTLDCAH